jgi:hypothetical protein
MTGPKGPLEAPARRTRFRQQGAGSGLLTAAESPNKFASFHSVRNLKSKRSLDGRLVKLILNARCIFDNELH